ncbi:hypothetical protein [Chitinophaga ginsengisegetis]|uniref:hypothetical protein n=1 Tax=Chitinophaga ginsengisegetis TaxID=393003 RepID=UPI000DB988A5|nr:hypothetical protein [Chitinophaga ginsengisegetis]MDR6569954.1 hypothetical protein [Chitinophaga ginsengisegetis]MDR6649687.1 hypothetical protein [Chitinophaga ginsengisegetis]MDR6656110.1 hypothetical protein [Chitinophaga ginsengisegetis]
MPLTKVLITVKSYPTVSSHYDEQVSIAGFREDGVFIRIYPIPFSKKTYEEQYQLYDWVELDLVRNTRDFRLESFRPVTMDAPVKKMGHLGTEEHWQERKAIVLKNVYRDFSTVIMEAKHEAFYTSLAVFKPARILDFVVEETEREWNSDRLKILQEEMYRGQVFEQPEDPFTLMEKLPYKFSFRFTDSRNEEITLPVEDWELASLYWKSLKKQRGADKEQKAIHEVRKKYLQEYARNTDLYFFLGTTQNAHAGSRQPFTIVGLFHPTMPPAVIQGSLF